jgi:hypothetical protein
MEIENSFHVPRDQAAVWAYLLDVERVVPCMPGAELTETIDDTHWHGRVHLAFGPVKMTFAGTVEMSERDDSAHRVVLAAKGREEKGKGAATATVTSWLEPDDGGTLVHTLANISLTGTAAQMSRGLLPEVAKKLTAQFAECLHAGIDAAAEQAPPAAAKPVGGIGLGLSALWASIRGFFAKLFGRR